MHVSTGGCREPGPVVSDVGGAIQAWDLTELLDPNTPRILHPGLAVYDDFMIAEWRTPDCATDDLTNVVWGLAVHLAEADDEDPDPDEIQVYAHVGRVGIEVLRFEPTASVGQRLVPIDHVETPNGQGGLRLRDVPSSGILDLLVADGQAGLRAFRYPQ